MKNIFLNLNFINFKIFYRLISFCSFIVIIFCLVFYNPYAFAENINGKGTLVFAQKTKVPENNPFKSEQRGVPQNSSDIPAKKTSEQIDFSNTNSYENSSENLFLKAQIGKKSNPIKSGVMWRIFSSSPNKNNKFTLLQMKRGGNVAFYLPPGLYFIHASFGRLSASKRILIKKDQNFSDTFIFNAGGLKLNAKLVSGTINPKYVTFSIYTDKSENDEKALIIPDIKPEQVVRLLEGKYHVVSKYGTTNAMKRTDVKIQTGKITEATIEHAAAKITLRLVRQIGGEALADTSWAILDSSGDTVWENVGAYATLFLAEGDYTVIAKNKDSLFQKGISVTSGKDQVIDISTEQIMNSEDDDASMD